MVLRQGRLVPRHAPAPVEHAPDEDAPTLADPPPLSGRRALLLAMFILFTLIPVSQYVLSLRLTPMTVMLLVGIVPMAAAWLARRYGAMQYPDLLMLGFSVWAVLALIANQGLGEALQPSGVLFLSTFGAYLAGRLLVRDRAGWSRLTGFLIIALIVVVPFVVFESITGAKPLIKFVSLFGSGIPPVEPERRMGLSRAQGSFEHPILLGIFMASLTSLLTYSMRAEGRKVNQAAGFLLSTTGVFCSLSTGPLLSLNVQFFLMAYSRLFRFLKSRWKVLIIAVVLIYFMLDAVTTRSPFHTFARYATFSAQSSYNRILIWQYGTASVWKYPWFGIGLGEWERPRFMSGSMDNFWLVQAVRYGFPAFLMYAGAVLAVLVRLGRAELADPALQLIRRGVMFGFVGTIIAVSSVHLWNASYVWFNFLLGASVWLTTAGAPSAPVVAGPVPPAEPGSPSRRPAAPARRR